jgi:ornithine cyclodeaminase/alanine dehydrogenase-like protein (mu-crystallin family)
MVASMKIYDSVSTLAALPFDRLIAAIADLFRRGAEVPPRHIHTITAADGSQTTVLIMPAWRADEFMGIKTANIAPGNSQLGLPGVFSTYLLYDSKTGRPLAQIDGDEITSRRTAAASALAASFLARPQSRRMLLVGAGRVASLLPEAYRAVLPIEEVAVWNTNQERAQALVNRLNAQGFHASVVRDLADAARRADVVGCATLATAPIVQGQWLAPGSHLDLIGSFTPAMREADDACFNGASLYVDTREALQKSGELLEPMKRGIVSAESVRGTLEDLCRPDGPRRQSNDERTIFKSVGTALEDLAAAMLVYEGNNASDHG